MHGETILVEDSLTNGDLPFGDVAFNLTDAPRVYVVEFGAGSVKIGRSLNPRNRIRSLRSARKTSGLAYTVTRAAMTAAHRGAHDTEKNLLALFAPSRLHGEYVSVAFEQVTTILAGMRLRKEPSAQETAVGERTSRFFDALQSGRMILVDDTRTVEEKLRLVRATRMSHGRRAAQSLWVELGLPLTRSMREQLDDQRLANCQLRQSVLNISSHKVNQQA